VVGIIPFLFELLTLWQGGARLLASMFIKSDMASWMLLTVTIFLLRDTSIFLLIQAPLGTCKKEITLVAEVVLNFPKSLEVLFTPTGDGSTRDTVRGGADFDPVSAGMTRLKLVT